MQSVNVPADPNGPSPETQEGGRFLLMTIAEKGVSSTDTVQPIQAEYRTTEELKETFRRSEVSMQAARRPLINGHAADATDGYLVDVGEFGVGLWPQGAAPRRPKRSWALRFLDGLANQRLAEFLCSLARVSRPLARAVPSISNLVEQMDQAGGAMWNRAQKRRR
jgi:hypothetical protein